MYNTLKYFRKYKKSNENNLTFYEWLLENSNYIQDYDMLVKIYEMFDLTDYGYNLKLFEKIKITNGQIMQKEMHAILEEDGFILPPL